MMTTNVYLGLGGGDRAGGARPASTTFASATITRSCCRVAYARRPQSGHRHASRAPEDGVRRRAHGPYRSTDPASTGNASTRVIYDGAHAKAFEEQPSWTAVALPGATAPTRFRVRTSPCR